MYYDATLATGMPRRGSRVHSFRPIKNGPIPEPAANKFRNGQANEGARSTPNGQHTWGAAAVGWDGRTGVA